MKKADVINVVKTSYRPPRAKAVMEERLRAMSFSSGDLERFHRSFEQQTTRDRKKLTDIIEGMLADYHDEPPAYLSRSQRWTRIARDIAADVKQAAVQQDVHISADQAKEEVLVYLAWRQEGGAGPAIHPPEEGVGEAYEDQLLPL